jgi:ABC-2 type transport system ATP-binding protein
MIEIKDLEKKFGETVVLDKLSFTVNKGEILGFLGPNGAGKSTTMKIITSFWSPSGGEILIDGLSVVTDSIATRAKIGYLPETVPLYDEMLVSEYLYFVADVRKIAKDKIKSRISEVVKQCSLEKVINRPIEELSKGYRQRVGLAQAIIHDPQILILDEPTTGLDPNQIIEIRELIKELGKEKTVIFSTHILSEVSATCDRVIIINGGKIVGEGTPTELTAKFAGQEAIYIKLQGPSEAVIAKLKSLPGVTRVEAKDKESYDIFGYEVYSEAEVDQRAAMMQLAISENWNMLEIKKVSISLEDVFRQLTK